MNNEREQDKIDDNYHKWWDEVVHHKTREKWMPAVQDYLDLTYMEPSHETFSPELVKRIIVHIAKYDAKWRRFPKDSFRPEKYKAHKQVYVYMEEELQRLQDEEAEKKRQADEKKRVEQQERESADEQM